MFKLLMAFLRLRIAQMYKNPDKAISILEASVIKCPGYAFSFLHLGLLYTQKENWEKAEYYLQKACNLDPSNPVFELFMGKVLIDAQQYTKAINTLRESINKDKHNQLSWSYLALAYLGEGNLQKFEEIVQNKPLTENHELQIRMILLLEKQTRDWNSHELQSVAISK